MINIDDLTLGQIKQLKCLLGSGSSENYNESECHPDIGKHVIIRTYSAGVHFGKLDSKRGKEVILKEAIRIWQWYGACSLSQLAVEGTKEPDKCKFAVAVNSITLEFIEIIPCTENAIKSITGVPAWKK